MFEGCQKIAIPFEVIETSNDKIYLVIYDKHNILKRKILYLFSGYGEPDKYNEHIKSRETSLGILDDLEYLADDGSGINEWENRVENPSEVYENIMLSKFEVIADNDGIYPNKMGNFARTQFDIDTIEESREEPKILEVTTSETNSAKSTLKSIYDIFDLIENNFGKPEKYKDCSLKTAFQKELTSVLLYFATINKKITLKEKELLNTLFDEELTINEYDDMIKTNDSFKVDVDKLIFPTLDVLKNTMEEHEDAFPDIKAFIDNIIPRYVSLMCRINGVDNISNRTIEYLGKYINKLYDHFGITVEN